MKNKIFIASSLFALTLLCQSPAHGQFPRTNPRQPTPETGKPKPTGTMTGGTEKVINSTLLIYTKND